MTKDITWNEKVRVSALRAACASSYVDESEFFTMQSKGKDGYVPEPDERRTERILARAEVFERWLTRGGWETIGQIVRDDDPDVRPAERSQAIINRPARDNPQA